MNEKIGLVIKDINWQYYHWHNSLTIFERLKILFNPKYIDPYEYFIINIYKAR